MSTPVISERVERALREIGLTEYESQAYLSLLYTGGDTAEAISKASNIPYTKIYSVLDGLEERGWVYRGGGRPRHYYPKAPTDALRSELLRVEARFEEYKEVFVEELLPIYERREIKEIPEIWLIRGEANCFNSILELLEKAKKEIILALPTISTTIESKYPEFAAKAFSLLEKIREGYIDVKVLTTPRMLPYLESTNYPLADIRICEDMFGGGIVVDEKEMILLLDVQKPESVDTAIWTDHEALTEIAGMYFNYLWSNSDPYSP